MCFSVVSQIFTLCLDNHYVIHKTILCFVAGLLFTSEFYSCMFMCNVFIFNLGGHGKQDSECAARFVHL